MFLRLWDIQPAFTQFCARLIGEPDNNQTHSAFQHDRCQGSAELKAKVVLQMLSSKRPSSELCRAHKLNPNVLNRWRKEFVEQAASIFERGEVGTEHEQTIAELERLVGQLTVQLEIAKKASSYLSEGKNGRR